jgi:hypothetical protein
MFCEGLWWAFGPVRTTGWLQPLNAAPRVANYRRWWQLEWIMVLHLLHAAPNTWCENISCEARVIGNLEFSGERWAVSVSRWLWTGAATVPPVCWKLQLCALVLEPSASARSPVRFLVITKTGRQKIVRELTVSFNFIPLTPKKNGFLVFVVSFRS